MTLADRITDMEQRVLNAATVEAAAHFHEELDRLRAQQAVTDPGSDYRRGYQAGYKAERSSPAPAGLDVLPCGYKFAGPGAGRCMQFPDHAIHRGAWLHREENHDYVAGHDRRKGERRAAARPAEGSHE